MRKIRKPQSWYLNAWRREIVNVSRADHQRIAITISGELPGGVEEEVKNAQ
jgi:hypothetical protein